MNNNKVTKNGEKATGKKGKKNRRQKSIKKIAHKISQSPGSLIYVGEKKTEKVTVLAIRYNAEKLEEKTLEIPCNYLANNNFKGVNWITISGSHDPGTVEAIGKEFGLHPLVMEDILDTFHRPKQEEVGNYIFLVLKMLSYNQETKDIHSEQVSIILGPHYVITFQEQEREIFEPVRQRIRKSHGRLRQMSADYLFYRLLDTIVDNYFLVLEGIGEEIETLEELLLENPTREHLPMIHKLKRDMISLRKVVWPLREVINGLIDNESPLIDEKTDPFLRDVYDHILQLIDTADLYREMISVLQELYLSGISNKMNEVMKVLTIIATIFIPLTFIVGIYGMNFEVMPELKWKYGYYFVWGVMVLVAGFLYFFFKRKKWL